MFRGPEGWLRRRTVRRRGWFAAMRSDRMQERFDHLWDGANKYRVPSLLLNSTLVDEGNRAIACMG